MGAFDRPKGRRSGGPAATAGKSGQASQSRPSFSVGNNVISDNSIKVFADLGRYYPLPAGYEYHRDTQGAPYILRKSDGQGLNFLIEESLLTFNEPYSGESGKTVFKTIEVFKHK